MVADVAMPTPDATRRDTGSETKIRFSRRETSDKLKLIHGPTQSRMLTLTKTYSSKAHLSSEL